MPTNTLPAILRAAAIEFASKRGVDATNALADARASVQTATPETRLTFVATPDGVTVSSPAVLAFAKGMAVTRTDARAERVVKRAAVKRTDDAVGDIGEALGHARVAESRAR